MSQDPRTSASIIHLALLGGQLVFVAVAVLIERSIVPPSDLPADVLLVVNGIAVFSAILASRFVGRMLLRSAWSLHTGSERLAGGLRAFIVRWAILEAAGLLSIVSYLLTGEISFLGIFAIVFVAFLLGKPSEEEWELVEKGSPSST